MPVAEFGVMSRIDHIAKLDGSGRQYLAISCGLFRGECAYGLVPEGETHHPFMIELADSTVDTVLAAYEIAVDWMQAHAAAHLAAHQPGSRS